MVVHVARVGEPSDGVLNHCVCFRPGSTRFETACNGKAEGAKENAVEVDSHELEDTWGTGARPGVGVYIGERHMASTHIRESTSCTVQGVRHT